MLQRSTCRIIACKDSNHNDSYRLGPVPRSILYRVTQCCMWKQRQPGTRNRVKVFMASAVLEIDRRCFK